MKGYSHAISGAAIWTLVATPDIYLSEIIPSAPNINISLGLLDVNPLTYGLGLLLASGAALLPDIDHHNGSIAWSLPKIGPIPSPTKVLCAFIGKISGGHRHGTHSILGIAIFTLLAFLAGFWKIEFHGKELGIGSGIFALFLTAFTLKVFKVGKSDAWFIRWFLSLVFAGVITWYFPNEWNTLPVIVGLGCFAHCLGDSLTVGGVPWFYPFTPGTPKVLKKTFVRHFWQSNGWFAFPILGTTDSGQEKGVTRERALVFLLSVYICLLASMAGYIYILEAFSQT